MKTKIAFATLSLLVGTLTLGAASVTADDTNPKFYGRTVGQWSALWWNWATAFSLAETPPAQEGKVDCSLGQPPGKVWFLAGSFEGTVERFCRVPANKALFFPIVNSVYWAPEDCSTVQECREFALIRPVVELVCEVDGKPCVYRNLILREQSPPFKLAIPDGSFLTEFGYAPGDRFPSITDGYYVILPPLSKGKHQIHFKGSTGDSFQGEPSFTTEVTYHLIVK